VLTGALRVGKDPGCGNGGNRFQKLAKNKNVSDAECIHTRPPSGGPSGGRGSEGRSPPRRTRFLARPFFASLWTCWTSVRKIEEGETTNDLFGFLTPNAEVEPIHPKAMPVIRHSDDPGRGRDVAMVVLAAR